MKKTADAGFAHFETVIPNHARAYTYLRAGKLTNINVNFSPALRTVAGMTSSAKELALWAIALQTDRLFDKEIDKKDSLKRLWQPHILSNGNSAGFNRLINGYALGWPIINRALHPAAIAILTNLSGSLPSTFIDEIAGFFIEDMKAENGFGLSPSITP